MSDGTPGEMGRRFSAIEAVLIGDGGDGIGTSIALDAVESARLTQDRTVVLALLGTKASEMLDRDQPARYSASTRTYSSSPRRDLRFSASVNGKTAFLAGGLDLFVMFSIVHLLDSSVRRKRAPRLVRLKQISERYSKMTLPRQKTLLM